MRTRWGRVAVAVALAGVLPLAGCGVHRVNVVPSGASRGVVKPNEVIPLRAGLVAAPEFEGYEFSGKLGARNVAVLLGPALQAGAERSLGAAFAGLVPAGQGGVEVLVRRQVKDVFLETSAAFRAKCRVLARWEVTAPDGQVLFEKTASGMARVGNLETPVGLENTLNKCFQGAIDEQYRNLIDSLVHSPWAREVRGPSE